MTELSLRDAARACGVGKTTILRAIQSGRMSAPRKEDGTFAIDPAELFRVFPPKPLDGPAGQEDRPGPRTGGQDAPPSGTGGPHGPDQVSPKVAALEAEIAGLKEIVRRLDLDKMDLRADRDAWKGQAESAQRLLTDMTTKATGEEAQARDTGLRGVVRRWLRVA